VPLRNYSLTHEVFSIDLASDSSTNWLRLKYSLYWSNWLKSKPHSAPKNENYVTANIAVIFAR